MKITDTRKEIINLISDYMDKTLSEGCLIEQDGENGKIIRYSENETMTDNCNGTGFWWIKGEFNTIGHYDITAVLKYIGNHNGNFQQTYKDDFIWMTGKNLEMSISDIAIPNKPLHLYTEEEDKQLLDLLLKLK